MAIHQKQVMTLQQKLSPQQIQMIKLLELPTVQLEQRIKQEIEENIVLEEAEQQNEEEEPQQISVDEYLREDDTPAYKMRANNYSKDDKPRQIPLSGGRSLQEYLIEQLGYRNLSEEEMRLAVYLVGSIDEDGYLRRDLESVAENGWMPPLPFTSKHSSKKQRQHPSSSKSLMTNSYSFYSLFTS